MIKQQSEQHIKYICFEFELMGVHGLWDILLTIAQKLTIQKLSGKVLAIDASIWIVRMSSIAQPNVKLRSLLDRIQIMKRHNVLPVFVFDGPPPAIKKKGEELLMTYRQKKKQKYCYQKNQKVHKMKKNQSQMRQISKTLQTLKKLQQKQQQPTQAIIQKLKLQSDILTKKYNIILEQNYIQMLLSEQQLQLQGILSVQDFDVLDLEEKQVMISQLQEIRWRKMRQGDRKRRSQSNRLSQQQKIKKDIELIQKKSVIRDMQDTLYRKLIKNNIRVEDGYQIIQGIYNGRKVIQKKKIKVIKQHMNHCQLKRGKMKNDFLSIMKGCRQSQPTLQHRKVNNAGQEEEGIDLFIGEFCSTKPTYTRKQQNQQQAWDVDESVYRCGGVDGDKLCYIKQGKSIVENSNESAVQQQQSNNQNQLEGRELSYNANKQHLQEYQGLQINVQTTTNTQQQPNLQKYLINSPNKQQQLTTRDNLKHFINDSKTEDHLISSSDNLQLQNFLALLGIPFIIAPGQAEAECANLQKNGIVDGVITEDSDVFLFGAKNVFRGVFENNIKYYSVSKCYQKLKFNQEKFIIFALFMGSDYTNGIKGIGIVNTMEILKVFNKFQKLIEFQKWAKRADLLLSQQHQTETMARNANQSERQFYQLHQKFKNNWYMQDDFPNKNVIKAYLSPQILSIQKITSMRQNNIFQSKKIMKQKLQILFRENMAMGQRELHHRIQLLQMPFLRQNQTHINDYFSKVQKQKGVFAEIRSKRLLKSIEEQE